MRRTDGARLWALFVALSPAPAAAFCRTTTVTTPADFQPAPDKCWDQGRPLFWKNACVGYSVQRDGSRQVSYEDAAGMIARAFSKWTSASCPTDGTANSRASIDVRDLGPAECKLVQYNQDSPNQHLIVFRDDNWPHNDVNNTLALTTVTFNPDTGEIYDADMEINTYQQSVTLGDPVAPDGYDFESIVTHETGHFLGLAHSGDAHATMFARYLPGSTVMRYLTNDDVAGICTVYPPDGVRATSGAGVPEDACDPTPRHGLSGACGSGAATSACSRSTVARTTGGQGALPVAVAGGAVVLLRRRRSRASRSAAPASVTPAGAGRD
jgi:hypothetical protein